MHQKTKGGFSRRDCTFPDRKKDAATAVNLVRGQIMNLQEYDRKKLMTVMEGIDQGKD